MKNHRIFVGEHHNLILTRNGDLYTYGFNYNGQLGFPMVESIPFPVKLPHFEKMKIKQVSTNYAHNLILTEDDRIFGYGSNDNGQLGNGIINYLVCEPIELEFFKGMKIKMINTGKCHSNVITSDNKFYSFGEDYYGNLGLGKDKIQVKEPKLIEELSGINLDIVKSGHFHTFVLTEGGTLYVFGRNDYGQLGLSHIRNVNTPIKHEKFSGFIKEFRLGCENSFILTTSGKLYGFGWNKFGQMGDGDTIDKIVPYQIEFFKDKEVSKFETSGNHTLVYTKSGKLYGFGLSNFGQLAQKENGVIKRPIEISFFSNKEIYEIYTGSLYTMVVLLNGDIYSFGFNSFGIMGNGSRHHHLIPSELTYFKEKGIVIEIIYKNERETLYKNFNLLKLNWITQEQYDKWKNLSYKMYFHFK